MRRMLVFAYGLVAYGAFLVAILYAIGFLANWIVPKSVDSGTEGPLGQSLLVNVSLLLLFVVQHTIMARPWFKDRLTRIIPEAMERSTFVLATSLILMLLYWQWRPIKAIVWQVDSPVGQTVLIILYLSGWAMVFLSSFVIDHFDLFGLRQVFCYLREREYTHPPFVVRSVYRWIRHPLMAGFLIMAWSAPTMTQGHLLFTILVTLYIFFGVTLEERDLLRFLGDDYRQYRDRTPMILPLPKKKDG